MKISKTNPTMTILSPFLVGDDVASTMSPVDIITRIVKFDADLNGSKTFELVITKEEYNSILRRHGFVADVIQLGTMLLLNGEAAKDSNDTEEFIEDNGFIVTEIEDDEYDTNITFRGLTLRGLLYSFIIGTNLKLNGKAIYRIPSGTNCKTALDNCLVDMGKTGITVKTTDLNFYTNVDVDSFSSFGEMIYNYIHMNDNRDTPIQTRIRPYVERNSSGYYVMYLDAVSGEGAVGTWNGDYANARINVKYGHYVVISANDLMTSSPVLGYLRCNLTTREAYFGQKELVLNYTRYTYPSGTAWNTRLPRGIDTIVVKDMQFPEGATFDNKVTLMSVETYKRAIEEAEKRRHIEIEISNNADFELNIDYTRYITDSITNIRTGFRVTNKIIRIENGKLTISYETKPYGITSVYNS